MNSRFGFGVPGALDRSAIPTLALSAEQAGFQTLWVNDTPNGNGLEALQMAASATNVIRLGIGVIPVDRKPSAVIAAEIQTLGLPEGRLIVGVGSGARGKGALDLVRNEVKALKRLTVAKVAVGALGPRMVRLGAEHADAVLLNWLSVKQAQESAHEIRRMASACERHTEVIAYVRVGLPQASGKVAEESDRYLSYPQYARHFHAMGVKPMETCVIVSGDASETRLPEYAAFLDETVIRAVPFVESMQDYQAVLSAVSSLNQDGQSSATTKQS